MYVEFEDQEGAESLRQVPRLNIRNKEINKDSLGKQFIAVKCHRVPLSMEDRRVMCEYGTISEIIWESQTEVRVTFYPGARFVKLEINDNLTRNVFIGHGCLRKIHCQ